MADFSGLPLKDIRVRVEDLCLWPRNPRLRTVDDEGPFEPEAVVDPRAQARILEEMSRPEFEIQELMDSIRAKGFVDVDSIFVQRLGSTGKYLVLEGNRRTSALKKLLNRREDYSPELISNIEEIPVKELLETGDPEQDEDNANFVLGIRHHGGVKEWAPLQRARNLYERYLKTSGQKPERFEYHVAWARDTGATFTVPTKSVRKMIKVYRVFEQLRQEGYEVRDDHFSLLDVALSSRPLGQPYFEQDEDSFLLSRRGMARFDKLCLQDGCSVTNPKQIAAFAKIVENGTGAERALVEAGGEDPFEILRIVERRAERHTFRVALVEAREILEDLSITDYQGTDEEKGEIRRISELVENRLVRLA